MIRDTSQQDRVLVAPIQRLSPKAKWVLGIAVGVVALGIALPSLARWLSAGTSISAERLRVAEVRRGKFVRDLSVQGKVVAAVSPTLYAPAPGIVALTIHAGDQVQKDQVLAEIDSPELKNRLAQEQAALQGLESDVERARIDARKRMVGAQKNVDQAEVDRVAAARELERNEMAFKNGAVAELTVLRAKDGVDKAVLTLNQAKQELDLERDAVEFDVKTKALARDRQRLQASELARQVEALKVRAPVSGQVGTLLIADRATVAANTGILTVVDLSALELEIQVPESYARDLAIGMSAEVSQGTRTFSGQISSVSPEVVGGQVGGRVRFAEAKPEGLRQNQRLTARIVFDERADALLVERGPFVDQGGGRIAYVLKNGLAERRQVSLGAAGLDSVEVLGGLAVGDRVVVGGADAFGDAEKVIVN